MQNLPKIELIKEYEEDPKETARQLLMVEGMIRGIDMYMDDDANEEVRKLVKLNIEFIEFINYLLDKNK